MHRLLPISVFYLIAGTKFEVPGVLDSGGQWGYNPYAVYKSPRLVVQELVSIVSKGGNYLLNVGLDCNGEWAPSALEVLDSIGDWMTLNGEALYETSPLWPFEYEVYGLIYQDGDQFYVTGKNTTMYCIMISSDDVIPESVVIPWVRPSMLATPVKSVELLGISNDEITWEQLDYGLKISNADNTTQLEYAFTFKIRF